MRDLADTHRVGPTVLPGLWVYGKIGAWRRRWLTIDRNACPSGRPRGYTETRLTPKQLNARVANLCTYLAPGYRKVEGS